LLAKKQVRLFDSSPLPRPISARRARFDTPLARPRARFDIACGIAIVGTLASLACACGDGGDNGNQLVSPAAEAGVPAQMGGGQNPPALPGQQPGGTGGNNPTGGTAGGTGGTGGGMMVPTGPVDLGQDSQGDTFFRADTLVLKAPNLFATLLIIRTDVTADGQAALNATLTGDEDKDGFVDMSLMLRFLKTTNPKGANGQVTPGGAFCPLPISADAACSPDKTFPFQTPSVAYENGTQPCTLTGTSESAPAPCFSTTPASLTMQLPILGAVPLQDAQVVGTWEGANIGNGFVRGFLPKTVAMATKLGEGLPPFLVLAGIQAGAPLTNFLNDSQLQKNARGEDGWWFLMSYTAKPAKFNPGP
jgi:hypothetical protein